MIHYDLLELLGVCKLRKGARRFAPHGDRELSAAELGTKIRRRLGKCPQP